MMGYVYRIEFPDGKSYIGATRKTPEERLARHIYQSKIDSNRKVYQAIRLFGTDDLKIHVLFHSNEIDFNDLLEKERYFISKYNSIEEGYNTTHGGEGGKLNLGKDNHFYGKHHSEETKKKLSNYRKGKHLSEETKKKIGSSSLGKHHKKESIDLMKKIAKDKNGKKVICVTTGKTFESVTDCSEFYNVCRSDIRKICERKRATAKGLVFSWLEDDSKPITDSRNIPIQCVETGKIFDSTKQACEQMGLRSQHVSAVLNGRQKTTKGFSFIYARQYRAKP